MGSILRSRMIPHLLHPKHIYRNLLSFFLFTLLLLLVSCTGGYLINEDQLAQIKIGRSTKEDVRKVLGEPMSVVKPTDSGSSFENWVYPLSKYASDPNTGVPPIGVVGAPISRGRRKTTEAVISFNPKGTVSSIKERRPPQ